MVVLALIIGLVVGWIVGWRLTSRSYQSLVSAIDEQNARLLAERRDSRSEAERLRRMLGRAEKAITNAKAKRDFQAQVIIDLTERSTTEATAA